MLTMSSRARSLRKDERKTTTSRLATEIVLSNRVRAVVYCISWPASQGHRCRCLVLTRLHAPPSAECRSCFLLSSSSLAERWSFPQCVCVCCFCVYRYQSRNLYSTHVSRACPRTNTSATRPQRIKDYHTRTHKRTRKNTRHVYVCFSHILTRLRSSILMVCIRQAYTTHANVSLINAPRRTIADFVRLCAVFFLVEHEKYIKTQDDDDDCALNVQCDDGVLGVVVAACMRFCSGEYGTRQRRRRRCNEQRERVDKPVQSASRPTELRWSHVFRHAHSL